MAVKEVNLPRIGLLKIYKRRGIRNMRLSLPYGGYVRLTMPSWLPYRSGVAFVKQKQEWIVQNIKPAAKPIDIKSLKAEAEKYLPSRIHKLANLHGYSYNNLKLRHLKSRWGSCSTQRDIALNIMLMRLPTDLIDHVLIHELVHTKVLKHGPVFWKEFEKRRPNAKAERKALRSYNPYL